MESIFKQSLWMRSTRSFRAAMLGCCVMSCVSWQSTLALQNGEDVRQRVLLMMITDTEQSLAGRQWLRAVEQFDEAWARACEREDPLLISAGASVDQLQPGQTQRLAGGRARLEELFLTAPDEFKTEYREQFESVAESRVSDAVVNADFSELRDLTLRYAFCPAAQNGLRILACQSIDRGDDLEAAMLLSRMLRVTGKPAISADSASVSLLIAICSWRAGLNTDALENMTALMAMDPRPVVLQTLPAPATTSAQDLKNWFSAITGVPAASASEWTQPGGDYRRFASRSRGPTRLEQTWSSDLLMVHDVLYSERLNPVLQSLRSPMLEYDELNSIVIPAAMPLRVGELVVVRTPCGIRAVRAADGALVWEVTHPDGRIRDVLQAVEESIAQSTQPADPDSEEARDEDTEMESAMQLAAEMQTATLPLLMATSLRSQLVRTNTTAQLTASADTLYVCEDASGTTADDQFRMMFRTPSGRQAANNFIRAYDLKTGLFKWEIGGQTQSVAQPKGKGNLLAGYYFLGAPLVLGNRTYVLAESSEGIILMHIAEPAASDSGPTNPRVVRSQLLTQPEFSISEHPVRKHAGLVPSYAQGVLICPTCDERIVAVSADDNAVRWVFRYAGIIRRQELGGDAPVLSGTRDPADSSRADLDSRWTDSLPRIAGDRVLVTPRDSDKLFCLDLQTGQERWRKDRGQFHTIAAISDDRIILCGNSAVQAFRLDDGRSIWSQSILDGIICGRPAADDQLLQIPTSEPAIVSLDLQTGRRLVSRHFIDNDGRSPESSVIQPPGNLLIIGNQLLSQNLDTITAYSQRSGVLQPVDQATERLLQNDMPGAITLLEQGLDDASGRAASRRLLIDVLMDSLRADFAANQSSIGRIRELISQTDEERPVAALLHLMLGISLSDAALLPDQLHSRSQRQLSELTRLIAQGLSSNDTVSAHDLADGFRTMLPELIAGQRETTATGSLRHLKSLPFVNEIRHALNRRTFQDRSAIQTELHDAAVAALSLSPERGNQLQFVRDLALSGMTQLALHVVQAIAGVSNDPSLQLMEQQIHFEVMRTGADTGNSVTALLDGCLAKDDLTMIRAVHREFLFSDVASPLNSGQRLVTSEAMTNRIAFEEWFSTHADSVVPEVSNWGANARIEQSEHRTVMPSQKIPQDIPDEAIPLYGTPGMFRGWSFVMLMKEQRFAAYDAEGRIRWTLAVAGAGEDLSDRLQLDSYLTASGHLLLLNLHGSLFSLDTSELSERSDSDGQVLEPRTLWTQRLDALATDPDPDDYRSYIDAADRITQFAPQPSGYYPVAPVTPTGVAVVAGRRLLVFDTLTGRLMWRLNGIARDAVLLTTRDTVIVLSENSQQIESRSLIDGTQLQVSGLPEWWVEAISNVGSSVSDFEIEPGENLLWRIAVHGQSCVLFRLGTMKSALECRDLMTDSVTWSIDLPAHSVFSNVANDVVAILSDEHELRLIRIDTGLVLASHEVMPVPEPRDLFLVHSLGNFVILPEGVDDPSIDLDPVMDAMHVYGRMYGVDAQTMALRWDEAIDHRYIRRVSAHHRVILPNSPILVLLNRGGPTDPRTGARRVHYGARLIDVRTGRELLNLENVGLGLNDFWLRIDAPKHLLELSFESHVFTLDFSDEQADETK